MKGDMMKHLGKEKEVIVVTTNSFKRKDGGIVMGKGAALQLKEELLKQGKTIEYVVGNQIEHLGRYGVICFKRTQVGVFQVKYHFKDSANLNLIRYSTAVLTKIALDNQDKIYHLNFPGIGNGHLSRERVEPILGILPDNVWVWEYD